MLKRTERGDTLIEVLFAVTVFSLIVVGSLALMNQGLAASQRAIEISQVRAEIDGQAEALRFVHDSYVAVYEQGINGATLTGPARQWYNIITSSSVSAASEFGNTSATTCTTPPARSFVMDTKTSAYVSTPTLFNTQPATTAKLVYGGSGALSRSEGLWVEAVRSPITTDATGYVDFHIRACWSAPGLDRPMTLGTIVRLYEPRN